MNLFDLAAKLTLDSSEYEKGLKNAEKQGSGFGGKLKSAMKVGGAAVATLGAASGALAGSFIEGVDAVADYGDTIDKQSQKLGISARGYQEWDAILRHSGSSIDAMSKGMITLQKKAADGAEAFEALGLTQEQVASMSTEELFSATIAGLQGMEEGAERTALASELLGGATKELGPLLNSSAEETEAMRQRVNELGGVMSDDAVKAAADYEDQLQDMQTALGGMKRGLLSDFMPSITTVMGGLTDLFSGKGAGKISEGIGKFVDQIAEKVPVILETGSEIVLSLGDAIVSNLPTLISAAGQTVMTLGTGIVQQLPMLLKTGLQVLLTLANGIAQSLPTLIPTLVSVVLEMVKILTDPANLASLVDAAIAIIFGLADGIIEALPILIDAVPEILMNLVTALVNESPKLLEAAVMLVVKLVEGLFSNFPKIGMAGAQMLITLVESIFRVSYKMYEKAAELIVKFVKGIRDKFPEILAKGKELVGKIIDGVKTGVSKMLSIGKDLVKGIWSGISGSLDWIKGKLREWVGSVVNFCKKILGIASPSKVFAEIGKWTALGFGEGFADEMPMVEDMMSDAMPDPAGLIGPLDFRVSGGARGRTDSELLSLLRDIRDNMDTDLVLSDGTLIGWMDKALGLRATQRARGNA